MIVAALLVLAVVRYACQFGRRLTAGQLSISVQNALRLRLMHTLLHLDGAAQSRISTGQVVSRSISDLQIVQGLLAGGPLSAGAAVQVVIAIGIMALITLIMIFSAVSGSSDQESQARDNLAQISELQKALAEGGTSFDAQYVNVNGQAGYFAHSLNAYGRTSQPCPRCGTPIVRVSFTNRSSHFCPRCQRRR